MPLPFPTECESIHFTNGEVDSKENSVMLRKDSQQALVLFT